MKNPQLVYSQELKSQVTLLYKSQESYQEILKMVETGSLMLPTVLRLNYVSANKVNPENMEFYAEPRSVQEITLLITTIKSLEKLYKLADKELDVFVAANKAN